MSYLPTLPVQQTTREMTDIFAGYNHQPKIADGEFYDMENLSSDYYPLLSNRQRRGLVLRSEKLQGIAEMSDKLAYVEDGALYYDGAATPIAGLEAGDKQLICMGAYICVFPDKLYYNTADPTDFGSMEAFYTSTGSVKYSLCKSDGTEYEQNPTVADTAPSEPVDGALWIDSSSGGFTLKIYSSSLVEWGTIPQVFTKIEFVSNGEIPQLFEEHDGVEISGSDLEDINGTKVIYALGGDEDEQDYIVVVGLIKEAYTQEEGFLSLSRTVPDFDFVCESQNRLWGCYLGQSENGVLNEIYGSALGDFKNWRQYMGLATDSWTASVGADGEWTGAVNYLGSPIFFKENSLHRITVSSYGAHRITETVCRGVQLGSAKSLQVVNETLYYKARGAVCAYQGGFPASVSEALGEELYSEAAAGALPDKYYIAMNDSAGARWVFAYDLKRGIWIKEDRLNASAFVRCGDELYAMCDIGLMAMLGKEGEKEAFVSWMAESGLMYYQYPDKKYLSRFNLRVSMEEGAEFDIYIQYDSSGLWERKGRVSYNGTATVNIPVWARRCDHLALRFVGKGSFKLYSIAKILEIGSDM